LAADTEGSVKSGAELLDRLIKDIVSELSTKSVAPEQPPLNPPETDETIEVPESLPRNTAFSLPLFIPLLSERIYTHNSSARQFLVSWISVLDSIPDLELVSFLPEFLDGFLNFLSDPSQDVRVSTSVLLADFLREIKAAAHAAAQVKVGSTKLQPTEHISDQAVPDEDKMMEHRDTGAEVRISERGSTEDDASQASAAGDGPESPVSESEGTGKGTYVPGQGVIVKFDKLIQILIPHLSAPGMFE
jgi:vacuole morphology and inheritance protein 14